MQPISFMLQNNAAWPECLILWSCVQILCGLKPSRLGMLQLVGMVGGEQKATPALWLHQTFEQRKEETS